MNITDDPNDERLKPYRGKRHDNEPSPQQEVYLALPEDDRAKGYLRPLRHSYRHKECETVTTMPVATAETYARDPWFYGGTYCCGCRMHRDLCEFVWTDGEEMSPRLWPDSVREEVMRLRKEF